MPGFDNSVMYASNVDFTGNASVSSQVVSNGQLLIGSTSAPNIRVGSLTSSNTSLNFTNGSGTIDITHPVILATLTLNSTDMLNLFTIPIEIVPAQGSGTFISPISVSSILNFNSIPYDVSGSTGMEFSVGGNSSISLTASGFLDQSQDMLSGSYASVFTFTAASSLNQPLNISVGGGNFINGDSQVTFQILYRVVTTGL